MWTKWAIDASQETDSGIFCFCPIDDKTGNILDGLSIFAEEPPGVCMKLILFHPHGAEACAAYVESRRAQIEELHSRLVGDEDTKQ